MIQVTFTENLQRHVDVAPIETGEGDLETILRAAFEQFPKLQPYIMTEQFGLRKHIMLALDDQLLQGDVKPYLQQPVRRRLHIMQALSGG